MIEISGSSAVATVTVVGDLDLAERDRFSEVTARLAKLAPQVLVLDLCRTTFIDSTGAAFVMSIGTTVRDAGRAVLRGAREPVRFVLEVCGALAIFEIDADHRCVDATG